MRAAKFFALAVVCASAIFAVALFQTSGAAPTLPGYISPLQAEPAHADAAVPSAPDPAHPEAPKSVPLPDFVPQPHALSQSEPNEPPSEEPEGSSPPSESAAAPAASSTATGSVSTGSDTSSKPRQISIKVEPIPGTEPPEPKAVWPKFIGAKTLFGAAKAPAPLEARAIGSVFARMSRGRRAVCRSTVRLGRRCGCRAIETGANPKLITLIEQFAKDAQKNRRLAGAARR